MFHFTNTDHPIQNAQRVAKSNATLGLVVLIGINTCQASFMTSKGIRVPIHF